MEAETNPTPTPTPAPAPSAAVTVPVTIEQLQAYQADATKLRSIEAENQRLAKEAEAARLAEIAAKEGTAKALEEARIAREREVAELAAERDRERSARHNSEREREIAAALTNVSPAWEGALDHVRTLISSRFSARDVDGRTMVVETATGRPARDVIPEILASKEFSGFVAAKSTGGSGATQSRQTAPVEAEPQTLGQLWLNERRESIDQTRPAWRRN